MINLIEQMPETSMDYAELAAPAQHSPGPWEITENAQGKFTVWPENEDLQVACRIESLPDAQLIAAAPELLAALKWVMAEHGKHYTLDSDIAAAVVEAIDKAEGRR